MTFTTIFFPIDLNNLTLIRRKRIYNECKWEGNSKDLKLFVPQMYQIRDHQTIFPTKLLNMYQKSRLCFPNKPLSLPASPKNKSVPEDYAVAFASVSWNLIHLKKRIFPEKIGNSPLMHSMRCNKACNMCKSCNNIENHDKYNQYTKWIDYVFYNLFRTSLLF